MIRALVRALVRAYVRASYGCWRGRALLQAQCLHGVFAQTCEKIHNGNRVSKARKERKRTRKIQAESCTVGTTDAFLSARYVQQLGLVGQALISSY